ncbi:MAG: hypothetical protein J6D47_01150 [Peptostreptococcaceae bacterium]|nr:hypothetical protein [Peptostreptococcaceae bacterium]
MKIFNMIIILIQVLAISLMGFATGITFLQGRKNCSRKVFIQLMFLDAFVFLINFIALIYNLNRFLK